MRGMEVARHRDFLLSTKCRYLGTYKTKTINAKVSINPQNGLQKHTREYPDSQQWHRNSPPSPWRLHDLWEGMFIRRYARSFSWLPRCRFSRVVCQRSRSGICHQLIPQIEFGTEKGGHMVHDETKEQCEL